MSETQTTDDVVVFLKQQHDEVRRLFRQALEGAADDRKDTFQCLVRLLAVHETAEESIVHPMVRRADGGSDVVDARLQEESDAKEALAELEKLDPSSSEFEEKLRTLQGAVEEHAHHEEQDEFPLLVDLEDDESRARLAKAVAAAESMAPTHPHPHGPESATGNLLVGPFAAIADRVRDALGSESR